MSRFSMQRVRAFWRRVAPLDLIALAAILLYLLARFLREFGMSFPFSGPIGLLFLLSLVYFVFRLTPWVRNKLLWSLRNRLIVAYLFIAVVPVVLLLSMAGLASYLLYMQFGAHILHDDIDRKTNEIEAASLAVRAAIVDEAERKASNDPAALLSRPAVAAVSDAEARDLPGLQIHVDENRRLLDKWGRSDKKVFTGMVESRGQLWLRCTRIVETGTNPFPLSLSVPVTAELLDTMASELGPIHLTILRPGMQTNPDRLTFSIDGKDYALAEEISSRNRMVGPRNGWIDPAITGGLTWEAIFTDTADDKDPEKIPVLAAFWVRRRNSIIVCLRRLGRSGRC